MSVALDGAAWLVGQLMSMKIAQQDQQFVLKRIQLRLSTLQKPLLNSLDLYYKSTPNEEKESSNQSTLQNFKQCLEVSYALVKKVQKRSCITRFCSAKKDLQDLKECLQYIQDSVDIIKNEKDMIELSLAQRAQQKAKAHQKTLQKTIKNSKAQTFWLVHIGEEKLQERIDIICNTFYEVDFKTTPGCEQIDKQYAIQNLITELDKDGSGNVDQNEFGEFFDNIWENEENKQLFIQEIKKQQQTPLEAEGQIMLSLLEECNLTHLLPKFKAMKFNSQSFLQLELTALAHITSKENAVKIFNAIRDHNNYLEKFKEIKDFLLKVQPQCYALLEKSEESIKPWSEDYTGICKVKCNLYPQEILIYCCKGRCSGPYYVQSPNYQIYGFMNTFKPDDGQPLFFYEASIHKSKKNIQMKNMILCYQYSECNVSWCLSEISPFSVHYSQFKKYYFPKKDTIFDYNEGPTIAVKNNNQVRIYYYQGNIVSYEQYIQYQKTKEFIRSDLKPAEIDFAK